MRLNVRCCCQPQKVLGTLPVPQDALDRGSFRVVLRKDAVSHNDDAPLHIEQHTISIRTILVEGKSEMAVYSDDRPIEFWRQLPSFEEGGGESKCS